MRPVVIHMMDYADAVMTNKLSPDILPVEDLSNMLKHIESVLPSMMHLPISLEHPSFLLISQHTHVLIANREFLLIIDVPIQNRAQQLQIYEIFSLPVTDGSLSAQYKVNYKYIGVYMMRQRQLPSQISSTEPVSMPMDSFAG